MKLRVFLREPVTLRCVGVTVDRRGPRELEAARALEQARADAALEQRWRERVASNPTEVGRTWREVEPEFKTPRWLQRQAS